MGSRILAFICAWAATFVLGSVAMSQTVIAYLESQGVSYSAGDYFGHIGNDLMGLLPTYGIILLVTLLIGYGVVALIVRRAVSLTFLGYIIGGFCALGAVHLLLPAVLGMTPLWAVSTPFSILLQALAGAVGGYVFVRFRSRAA